MQNFMKIILSVLFKQIEVDNFHKTYTKVMNAELSVCIYNKLN